MNLIEKIKCDMVNGTPGPWDWEGGNGPENIYAKSNLGVWSEPLLEDALDDDECEDPEDEKWVCGIWGDIDNRNCTDARRIARVPDMEAALLAAEELADAVDEWSAKGRTEATAAALNTALGNYRAATGGAA